MARLTLLLSRILTFIVVAICFDDDQELELNRMANIIPMNYNIKLRLRDEENLFLGECDINIQILNKTQYISLFVENLAIMQTKLIDAPPFNQNKIQTYKVVEYIFDYKYDIISFYFKDTLSPGYYNLYLKYTGIISSKGGFQKIVYPGENGIIWLSATHFNSAWVRRLFPCSTLSHSIFNISIEHSDYLTAISNTPVKKVKPSKDINRLMTWTDFERIIIYPNSVSIIVTSLTRNFIHEYDIIDMWCEKESINSLKYSLTIIRNITVYLEQEWEFQMFPIVHYIVIPNFQQQNNSIIDLGSTFYGEADITYNKETDSIQKKYNLVYLIAFKSIHHWFKNITTPFGESSLWLNKGFDMFFAMHTLNQTSPNLRIIDLFVVQRQHEVFHFDIDNRMLPPSYQDVASTERFDIKAKITDIKASVILRMLEHSIADKHMFWQGLHTHLTKKNYDTNNFWDTLKVAHKARALDYDIKDMMYPWISQKGYPVLHVTYNIDYDSMNITILNLDLLDEDRWIPVTFTTETNCDFRQTRPRLWFQPPRKPFNPPYDHHIIYSFRYREYGWILLNIQQTAYYRVNYDDRNWYKLINYLNGDDYLKIHVLNRAQMIDDAFHFLLLGQLKPNIFWDLTKYLSRETDYIAWYPMFKAIEYISNIFPFQSVAVNLIQEKLKEMLNGTLQNIKLENNELPDDDFTQFLIQEIVQWACYFKEHSCILLATIKLDHYLSHPIKFSSWWKKWTFCYGLMSADNVTWRKVLEKIKGNNDKILYFLTCSNHLVEINNYVLATYTRNDELHYESPKDNVYDNTTDITLSTITQHGLKHLVFLIRNGIQKDKFDNLLLTFEMMKPRQINMLQAIVILINNIYSIEHLNEIHTSFSSFVKLHGDHMKIKLDKRKAQLNNQMKLIERIQYDTTMKP